MKAYYEDDQVTIYNGDCLAIIQTLEAKIDITCTDPPYSSGARQAAQMRARGSMRRESGVFNKSRWFGTDNLSSHGFAMLVRLLSVELLWLTKPAGHLISFIDWRQWPVLAGSIEAAGWDLRSCLVWDKEHYGMGNGFRQQAEFILHASHGNAEFLRHDLGTVFRAKRPKFKDHPTEKPLEIVTEILSALPGEVVLDPFMGSGTTLRAAKNLGRKAIGIEQDESFCELAAKRMSQGNLF